MRPHLPARGSRPARGPDPGLDQPKVLHSEALQLEGQLQAALMAVRSDEQLFGADLHDLRHRLVGCYVRLLLGAYAYAVAHDVELALWRHGFHLLVEACRSRLRRGPPGRGAVRLFLAGFLHEAAGFYQALLRRLLLLAPQAPPLCLDFARLDSHSLADDQERGRQQRPQQRLDGQLGQSCHRCLIFLGDLARYQSMYGGEAPGVAVQAARRYYLQAFHLCPDHGRAFNQLGVLWSGQRATLFDALYCYCRALGATRTLGNAADNIRGCLDRTRAHAAALSKEGPLDLGTCRVERLVQHFCTGFAAVHHALFAHTQLGEASSQLGGVVVAWACLLNRLLGAPPVLGLDCSLLAKAQVVNMAMAHHLAPPGGSGQEADSSTQGLGLVQRLGLLMFKHTAMAMLQALAERGSQLELQGRCDRACGALLPVLVVFGDWLLCQLDASLGQHTSPQALLLPGAFADLDRVRCVGGAPDHGRSVGAEEQPFWTVMAMLATQLTAQASAQAQAQADTMAAHWLARALHTRPGAGGQADTRTPALGEDIALRGFAPLAPLHSMLAFPPTGTECGSTVGPAHEEPHRMARLLAFMKTAAALPPVVAPLAVDLQGLYHHTEAEALHQSSLAQAIDSWRTDEVRRRKEEVMRAMAQQRLQAEVQALEGQVRQQRARAQPYAMAVYVIPDICCFVNSLRAIQEIVGLQRYVVLVAQAAVAGLDELKKGSTSANRQAREATRWLEHRFRQGDRWIRAQAREEAMGPASALDPVATLPPHGVEARLFHCARYFAHHAQPPAQEGAQPEEGRQAAVVLLTERVAELQHCAQACHVAIDTVDRFLRLARQNAR